MKPLLSEYRLYPITNLQVLAKNSRTHVNVYLSSTYILNTYIYNIDTSATFDKKRLILRLNQTVRIIAISWIMMGNLKGLEPAPNTAHTRGSITIKYNIHRIIIIILIKNYYVNSYLTTCMAQSIKLVSCNNNNKDTTIYLLVSLSSFDLCLFITMYILFH